MENTEKYLRSLKNKNNCLSYLEECRRLTKLIKRYQPECKHLFENQAASVVREEYSFGGYALHRGYYCPSLIDDIIIGGCNRGKLLKRITGKIHLACRYGFNAQNQLVIAEHLEDYSLKEVLIYEKHLVTGISFNEDGQIRNLSECEYKDGKIKTYTYGTTILLKDQNIVNEYNREEYHYSDDCLDFVHRLAYTYHESMPILEHSKYEFQHDEEGYLSQYYIKPANKKSSVF